MKTPSTPESHLITEIRHWLDKHPDMNASRLEQSANLANGTIGRVLKGGSLTKETMARLLEVLPDAAAEQWTIAYLKDLCPRVYLEKIAIQVKNPAVEIPYPGKMSAREQFHANLDALRREGESNQAVIDWINLSTDLLFHRSAGDQAEPGKVVYDFTPENGVMVAEDPLG